MSKCACENPTAYESFLDEGIEPGRNICSLYEITMSNKKNVSIKFHPLVQLIYYDSTKPGLYMVFDFIFHFSY